MSFSFIRLPAIQRAMRTLLPIYIAISAIVLPAHVIAAPPSEAHATAANLSPLSVRMLHIPDENFRAWFNTMLEMGFRKGPDWEAFFGDVGPTEGCGAFKEIKASVIDRDLAAFRAAYISKVSTGMNQSLFSDVPDHALAIPFNSRINRFEQDLGDFLRPRVIEIGNAARQWADSHGYRGRRLGYNVAGVPYWGTQPALTGLVCILPNDAGLLRGWKR